MPHIKLHNVHPLTPMYFPSSTKSTFAIDMCVIRLLSTTNKFNSKHLSNKRKFGKPKAPFALEIHQEN